MIEVRKFGPELKNPLNLTGAKGLAACMIQLPGEMAAKFSQSELADRYSGSPLVLDRPNTVVALYLDENSQMHEHSAPEPILFIVTGGKGYVRVGGPAGETVPVTANDALIWPAGLDHKVWTEDSPLQGIVFHYAAD